MLNRRDQDEFDQEYLLNRRDQDEFDQEYLQNIVAPAAINTGAAPVYTNSTFNAADSSSFGPTLDTAYKPGQTLQDYLAAQKAAFVPQHVEAVADASTGGGDSSQFIPGSAAYDTTYNTAIGINDWYKAQNKTLPVPKGWSTGSLGTHREFNETANAYTESEQGVPGTDLSTGKNMAYRLKSQDKYGNQVYEIQEYGPNGLIGESSTVKYGLYDQNPVLDLIIQAGMAGVLGPLAGQLGALAAPGLGAGAQMAIGQGLVGAGKTAAMGGDLGDALKSGLTSGATSFIGSTVGDALPKGVAPTGIKSLDTALTKGMQSAAGSGVTSLLTGNKNILSDALTAGLGAAAGSGVNSVISDAAGSTGLPPAALNIIGPAAIAELMGKDPTGAALKAAVGEITGAIKGSVAEGKQTGPGVTATRDLLSGITEPGEYPQDDGSVISVSRPEKGPNKGKLVGSVYSKEDVTRQANEEAYASWPQQITSNVDAEQAQLLSFANQAANPNLRQNVLRDMRQEDKDYIERSLAEGGTPQQIINAYIKQEKSPEDAARMVNAIVGPKSLSTEETVPSAKFEDAEDFTALPDEFEPSSGDLNKVLQNAGLVQAPVEITGQTPSDYGLDFGAFAERPETSLDAAPQKVEITGQTPDTELMRFLEANGLTSDEAQKVLITGKDQDAGTDYNKFFELSPEGTPLPSRVNIRANKLLEDMGLDLGAYNEGPVVAPDKLINDLLQRVEITGTKLPDLTSLENVPEEVPDTPQVLIRDKLVDDPPWEDPWMPPVEQPPVDAAPPEKPIVKPVIKPVVDPKRPGVPKTTTDPGSSYTIPGTTTQLHQELMQLPETDILRMLNPALYAYKDAQKRKKPSGDDQMMALLNELGYRS